MILKLTNGNYVDVDSYGCETWGTTAQNSIVKNQNGEWSIRLCICIDTMHDEWRTEWTKLDVEEELYELPEGAKLYNEEEYEMFMRMISDREMEDEDVRI